MNPTKQCGKICYTTKKNANKVVRNLNRLAKRLGKKPRSSAYHCFNCQAWHTTRAKPTIIKSQEEITEETLLKEHRIK